MAEKKADGAKPRSGWGGRRPGTGRKKGQGKGLTEHLQVSVTPLQKETFRRAGGNMWMRHVLDVESAAELPPGAMVMKTELSHAEIEYEVSSVQAGFPSPADDYAHEPLDFNDLLAPNPENTFVVHVTGDSMVDAGITPGCLLVVSRLLEPRDGDIGDRPDQHGFHREASCEAGRENGAAPREQQRSLPDDHSGRVR